MVTYTITEAQRQDLITAYQSNDSLGLITLLRNLPVTEQQEPAYCEYQWTNPVNTAKDW